MPHVASYKHIMSVPQVYLDAILEPPRTLSRRGCNRVMLALGGLSFTMGALFISVGAYPVAGFLGAEVFLLWLFMRKALGDTHTKTRLHVTADHITISKTARDGSTTQTNVSTYFAQVHFDPRRHDPFGLSIRERGHVHALGEHLTTNERQSLADTLTKALTAANNERHTTHGDIK